MIIHGIPVNTLLGTPKCNVDIKALNGFLTKITGNIGDEKIDTVCLAQESQIDNLVDMVLTSCGSITFKEALAFYDIKETTEY